MKSIFQEDNELYKLAPLSEELVKSAEKVLKIKLPEFYIEILEQQNGGCLKLNAHLTDVPTSWADDHVNVDFLFGIGSGNEKGILDNEYLIQEWDLPKNVVLISGEGHSWIALDYRDRESEPPIIFVDIEQNQEIRLANNFKEFINGLVYIEPVEDHSINVVLSQQEIKDYYTQIDYVIREGTPKEIDRLFTEILSTNFELTRYMVEKMRQHKKPKVHFNLLLYLSCCAEGDNVGSLEDDYLYEVLHDFSKSSNKDVKEFALYSLEKLQSRLNE